MAVWLGPRGVSYDAVHCPVYSAAYRLLWRFTAVSYNAQHACFLNFCYDILVACSVTRSKSQPSAISQVRVDAPSGAQGKGLQWAELFARWLAAKSGPQPGPHSTCFVSSQSHQLGVTQTGKLCGPAASGRPSPVSTGWVEFWNLMASRHGFERASATGRKAGCLTIPRPRKGIPAAALFFVLCACPIASLLCRMCLYCLFTITPSMQGQNARSQRRRTPSSCACPVPVQIQSPIVN